MPSSRETVHNELDALYPELYAELRKIAHNRLRDGFRDGTLNTTALVHEAYLRLANHANAGWNDRGHFLALASRAMRFILIDTARARAAEKRGRDADNIPIESIQIAADDCAADLLALDEALDDLSRQEARLGEVIEYRFFGGLTYEEIAEATGRSVPTVKRDWRRARSWLYLRMHQA
jgi:RNA polymerase sigma factor (TIGR02999 family)